MRERLLDAAARLVARQGYQGAKIQEIVQAAGLSSGAIYGRFRNKDELVREAIITRSVPQEPITRTEDSKIGDLVARNATVLKPGLSDTELLLLEAYVNASRDPAIAEALTEANHRWRRAVAPDLEAAIHDGTVAKDVDPDAALFFTRILRLGLLLHRGSGLPSPDQDAWENLVTRLIGSFGDPHTIQDDGD